MTRYRRVGGASKPRVEAPQQRYVFMRCRLATVERPDGTTIQVDEYRPLIVNNAIVSVVGTKASAQAEVGALVDGWDESTLDAVRAVQDANGDAELTNEVDAFFTSPKLDAWFDTYVVEVRDARHEAFKPTS